MKVAIIGSRKLIINDLEKYIPPNTDEIVSGGAKGVDLCAASFAKKHGLKLTEFLPEWSRFGRGAPLRRNLQIIEYADEVIAFWDGSSKGTLYVIEESKKKNKKLTVYIVSPSVE